MRNERKLALRVRVAVSDAPAPDAAFHLSFVTTHRATISSVVEKAGGIRHTAPGLGEGTRDWKPTVTAPGVGARVQRKAGAGAIPAGVRGRWRGPECAPVMVLQGTDCPSTRASASADRMTPAARMHASSRNFPLGWGNCIRHPRQRGRTDDGDGFFVMAQKASGGTARMQIETIAASFAEFEQAVLIPSGYDTQDRREAATVFYAGADAVLRMLRDWLPLDRETRWARLRAILNEMESYRVAVVAEAKASDTGADGAGP